MAIWPFRRKQMREEAQQPLSTVPAEVQDYYESTRRSHTSIVWLLALGTLVVTLVLAMGIFFGGRWTYRSVTHKKNKPQAPTAVNKPSNTPVQPAKPDQKSGTSSTQTQTPSSPPASTTPATPAPSSQTASPSTPRTGPTEVPHTGPDGDD